MKVLNYCSFIIEKDNTISTNVYYIRRQNGRKWKETPDAEPISITSISGTLEDAKQYIQNIDYFHYILLYVYQILASLFFLLNYLPFYHLIT